jgi:polysaccharide biosynthesis PFTS motif protein
VHPDSDATKLIQKTAATISIPFTSTALIAKSEGKPSVYYDPSGVVQKDDRAAHGIPVLSSIDELEAWVKTL